MTLELGASGRRSGLARYRSVAVAAAALAAGVAVVRHDNLVAAMLIVLATSVLLGAVDIARPPRIQTVAALGAAVIGGVLVARDAWELAVAALALATTFIFSFFGTRAALLMLIVATFVQAPLGSIGSVADLTPAELLIPVVVFGLTARNLSLAAVRSAFAIPRRRSARIATIFLCVYALVVVGNFFRSKLVFHTAHVNRPFYAYFIALTACLLAYVLLKGSKERLELFFRVIYVLSVVMCIVGVTAAAFGLRLNLGVLRYSVYDYGTGAVRVGFLETFGTAGLALALTRRMPMRWLGLALFATALVVSGGRSAVAGALLGAVVYLVLVGRWRPLVALAAAAALIIAVPAFRHQPQVQRLTSVGPHAFVSNERAFFYHAAIRSFRAHPVFGTGVREPGPVAAPDPITAAFYSQELKFGGHGTFHSLLKNFGLVGFIPFVGALAVVLCGLARRRRDASAAFFLIVLVAQAVSLYAGGNGSDPLFFFLMGGAVALLASRKEPAGAEISFPQTQQSWIRFWEGSTIRARRLRQTLL